MPQRIKFPVRPEKIVETMLYLAHKGIELSQYKTVKLLYLSDREHLRRFGRPISFDRYVAMEYGPVASNALNIINGKTVRGVNRDKLPFSINKIGDFSFIQNPKREIDRSIFSKSDLLILDEVVGKYGRSEFGELYELTHKHFAYSRAWENRATKADPMFFEDFFGRTREQGRKSSRLRVHCVRDVTVALGDVYKFVTNKVIANNPKNKYHIAIRLQKEGYFLYISSNAFEGAMAIDRADWPEMPKPESFVSFSRVVSYQSKDLKGISIKPCGRLTDNCIQRLRAHALDSLVLEKWEMELIVSSIDDVFEQSKNE